MKTHGMQFRDDMAEAIRNGTKTQTRRPMDSQPKWDEPPEEIQPGLFVGRYLCWSGNSENPTADYGVDELVCPWQVGDRIYVQEDFQPDLSRQDHNLVWYKSDYSLWEIEKRDGIYHSKDTGIVAEDGHQYWWARAENMKPWAARTWLEVVKDPFPQRIRDISEADAQAEGANAVGFRSETEGIAGYECRIDFNSIWESLYPGSWERNEWVWALNFKLIEGKGGGE